MKKVLHTSTLGLENRTACLLVCLTSHADALRAPGFGFVTLSCLAILCQASKEKIKTAGDLLTANARES